MPHAARRSGGSSEPWRCRRQEGTCGAHVPTAVEVASARLRRMSVLNLSRPRPAAGGSAVLFIVFSVLGSLLLVLLGSVEQSQTAQIFYGSLAIFLLGLAAAVIMTKG